MALIAKEYNWETQYGVYMDGNVETDAYDLYMPEAQQRYPWLDEELRELIGRMMAKQEQHRWPLAVCLERAETAVRTRTAASYGLNAAEETDDAIVDFVQRAFHEAYVPPPPPPGRPLPQPPGRPLPEPPLQMFENEAGSELESWVTVDLSSTESSGGDQQRQGDEMQIDSEGERPPTSPPHPNLRPAKRLPRPPLAGPGPSQLRPLPQTPPPVPPHLEGIPPPVPPHLELPPHLALPSPEGEFPDGEFPDDEMLIDPGF